MTTPYFGPLGGISLPKWLVNPETDDEYAQRFPGTYGDPVSAPDPVAPPAPQGPGWQARLFGGADPLAGGLLNPQEARGLGRQSLLNFGLNVLQNSGPSPYKRGLGEILAGGVLSGQQAYQQGTQQALGAQGIVTQRQNQARLQALHQRYAGRSDTASLTAYLNDLIGIGTPEALAAARSLSEVLKSQQERAPVRGQVISEVGPDGKVRQRVIDPTQMGQTFGAPDVPRSGLSENQQLIESQRQFQRENSMSDDFNRLTKPWMDVYQLTQGAIQRVPQSLAGDGAAQIELLYAFIRALDPESVVREGEVALARQASSPYAQAQQLASKYAQGENVVIPQSLVRQMGNLLGQRSRGLSQRYETTRRQYVARGKRWKLPDPEGLFLPLQNYNAEPETPATPSPDPTGGLLSTPTGGVTRPAP